MAKTSKAQAEATRRYEARSMRRIIIPFNRKTDADVLQKLDSVPNKQGYIKKLIREDL